MSKGMKSAVVVVGLLGAALALARPAAAAEEIFDDFSIATPAPGTLLNIDLGTENVINDTAMSTVTAKDTGVGNIIGGVRQLDVSVGVCVFCALGDNVIAGIVPASQVLSYSASADADGSYTLIYDADGAGLNENLSFAQGIRLAFLNIDLSSYPLDVMITLTSGANVATSTIIDNTETVSLNLDFPFAGFANIENVDLTNLTKVEIRVNPSEMEAAADLQMGPITTFGTPPIEPACSDGIDNDNNGLVDCLDPACIINDDECAIAPVMSTGMTTVLIGLLATCGLWGIARMRPRGASPS